MSSFVNLMGDLLWSEADIVNRMESMIREHCSPTEELIIHRKMIGAAFGMYELSGQEEVEIALYAGVCSQAQLAGRAARADMALLATALAVEAAQARLAQPEPEEEDAADVEARAQAQALIDNAGAEVLALVQDRAAARALAAPPPEPVIEPEPQPEPEAQEE